MLNIDYNSNIKLIKGSKTMNEITIEQNTVELLPAGGEYRESDRTNIGSMKRIRNDYGFDLVTSMEYVKRKTRAPYINQVELDKKYQLTDNIADLEEAQDLIRQAIELIEVATHSTSVSSMVSSYLTPNLEMSIDDEHHYLGSNQCTIQYCIDQLEGDE